MGAEQIWVGESVGWGRALVWELIWGTGLEEKNDIREKNES